MENNTIIYGYYIDNNNPDESNSVHQIEGLDNYGFSPIKMNHESKVKNNTLDWGSWKDNWIMPKPCMLHSNGTVAYYLNPNDYTKKVDGSSSDIENLSFEGNAMMEWVPIFKKVVNQNNKMYVYISNKKVDEDYECYSALKEDGTYAEHFYTPIYEGCIINGKMRSMSTGQKPTANTTLSQEMTYARANGTGWDITCWADEDLIFSLAPLVLGRLNIQKAIGGYNSGNDGSLIHNCGSANKKGMFFGHNKTSLATKFFGMENMWGHRARRCVGLMAYGQKVYVKMTKHTSDGSTVSDYNNEKGTGYIHASITLPSSGYIKSMQGKKQATMLFADTGCSSATYYCNEGCSSSSTSWFAGYLGGDVYYSDAVGLFCCYLYDTPSYSSSLLGASLSYKPF